MRAGSTAKATATAAGRGHIRGLGRPGVSSSHPAVLKSPAARVFGICMPNTRPHSIAGTLPSPYLLGPHTATDARSAKAGRASRRASWPDGLDKCRICGQPREASTPALPHGQNDVHHFVGFWRGLHRAADQSLVTSSDLASEPYRVPLPLLLDVASRPPAGPAKSRAAQGCPSQPSPR